MQVPIGEKIDQNHKNGYNSHGNGYNGHSDEKRGHDDEHYKKPLQIVGLAKKAGLLAVGSDTVLTAIETGKAELVVFSSDTSEGSIRRIRYAADKSKSEIICIIVPYTKFEFSRIAGRGSPGTLAVLDLGLANELLKRLSALDMTRYGEIARLLETKVVVQRADKAGKANRAVKTDRASKTSRAKMKNRASRTDRPDNRRAKV